VNDYVLDITNGVEPPVFVCYENNEVVFGLNVVSDKCPGNLVGVIHLDGQKEADKWVDENPNWHEKYGKGE
jgi:hypothetical protein